MSENQREVDHEESSESTHADDVFPAGSAEGSGWLRYGRPPLEHTPSELVPNYADYPAGEPTRVRSAVLLREQGAPPAEGAAISAPLSVPAERIGFGVASRGALLTHEQTWTRKGMALGNLLHSLALAPGEATRVVVRDWTHRTRGTGDEQTSQNDTSAADQTQQRALSEIQNSVANETQHGASRNEGTSTSAQAAFSLFGAMSSSVASNYTLATSATSSDGSKTVGADENQRVHQSAQQHAQAARTRRASVVREVDESDSAGATTRVVANYNRAHALTVQYFEVVEVYDVETTLANHQRCVFVPIAFMSADELITNHRWLVAAGLDGMGLHLAADHVRAAPQYTRETRQAWKEKTDVVRADLASIDVAIDAVEVDANDLKGFIDKLQKGFNDAVNGTTPPNFEYPNKLNADATELSRLVDSARAHLGEADAAIPATDLETLVQALVTEFNEYFNQCVWSQVLTPGVVHQMLDGATFEGAVLNEIIGPTPVAVSGNLVGFPLLTERFPAEPAFDTTIPAVQQPGVISFGARDDEALLAGEVAVPTGGVFAEAILGQAVAAERIDLTRFWDWNSSPLPLMPTQVKAVELDHTQSGIDTSTGQVDQGAATIAPLASLPDPMGTAALLAVLKDGSTFRDMSNSDGANEAFKAAVEGAQKAAADAQAAQTENMKTSAAVAEKIGSAVFTEGASTLIGGLANDSGSGPKAKPSAPKESGTKSAEPKPVKRPAKPKEKTD